MQKEIKVKASAAELAKELGVSVNTVYRYKATSPTKLALMLDGIRWRKYVREQKEKEFKNAKKADNKDTV
ncbi:MAG: helix-turn-helix domain-containing protein [Campylobacteraceae bacterium]|jgi:DNA-binding IclR family transcriptional regulator|nr:helix-turn-helix domain-containing protein [Campylobacteraceae bacterium]